MYNENQMSDPSFHIDRAGSVSLVRDSRLDWLSTSSLTIARHDNCKSKHLFVNAPKQNLQGASQHELLRHSWAAFSRRADNTSHVWVSINPAYGENSDSDGSLYENMMVAKPKNSVKDDHLYDNLPPLMRPFLPQDKQSDEKNDKKLGTPSLLHPPSCSTFHRQEFNQPFLATHLSDYMQVMSSSFSLQNLTTLYRWDTPKIPSNATH